MITTDLHVHTTFCDGKNTAAEMAEAALQAGVKCLGFSGHSHTAFDESYCMSPEGTLLYQQEVRRLQREYAGRMEIRLGIEQDFYSDADTSPYDYVIGSVHYLKCGDEHVPVDESAQILREAANRHFGGDMLSLAECYFETEAQVAKKTGCDIIGHFDLISKFLEREPDLLDVRDPRYVAAWQGALEALLPAGKPFEINTGAISRGYRTTPYPAPEMISFIKAHGGKLIMSSDSHSRNTLLYRFDEFEHLL